MNVDDVLPTTSKIVDVLADAQAIAVQTVSDRHSQVWLLSGRVKTLPEDESSIAAIDPSHLWTWGLNERDVEDETEWLNGRDDGPPRDVQRGFKDDYSLRPVLNSNDDETVTLVIPEPVYNGSGVLYYTPQPHGRLSDFSIGPLVSPETLLPDGAIDDGNNIQETER